MQQELEYMYRHKTIYRKTKLASLYTKRSKQLNAKFAWKNIAAQRRVTSINGDNDDDDDDDDNNNNNKFPNNSQHFLVSSIFKYWIPNSK